MVNSLELIKLSKINKPWNFVLQTDGFYVNAWWAEQRNLSFCEIIRQETGAGWSCSALHFTFFVEIQLGKISICLTKLSQTTHSVSTGWLLLNYLLVLEHHHVEICNDLNLLIFRRQQIRIFQYLPSSHLKTTNPTLAAKGAISDVFHWCSWRSVPQSEAWIREDLRQGDNI